MMQKMRLTPKLSTKDEEIVKLREIKRILSALSNEDSLKIFGMASEGITCSTEAIKKLGLTQKRYYTRLSELLETKLVQKDNGVYRHTLLGSAIYRMIDYLNGVVEKGEQLELIDKVRKSRTLSDEEKEKILNAIVRSEIGDFLSLLDGGLKPSGIIYKFENIVNGVVDLIKKAEKRIYLATRYTRSEVIEALSKRLGELQMYCISSDKSFFSQITNLLRLILSHPSLIEACYKIFNSPNIYIGFVNTLPYSFIVVDEKWIGLEIPNPEDNSFFFGLFFENKILAEKLIEIFNSLKKKAEEDTRRRFSKEFLEKVKVLSS